MWGSVQIIKLHNMESSQFRITFSSYHKGGKLSIGSEKIYKKYRSDDFGNVKNKGSRSNNLNFYIVKCLRHLKLKYVSVYI
jgi:hypothetical protein